MVKCNYWFSKLCKFFEVSAQNSIFAHLFGKILSLTASETCKLMHSWLCLSLNTGSMHTLQERCCRYSDLMLLCCLGSVVRMFFITISLFLFSDCRMKREAKAARSDEDAEKLWKLSEEYTKIKKWTNSSMLSILLVVSEWRFTKIA